MLPELGVLGAILHEPAAFGEVARRLAPDDFYEDKCRRLFAVMADLHAAGQTPDLASVGAEIARRGWAADVGDLADWKGLRGLVVTAAQIDYHATLVERRSLFRRLVVAAALIERDARNPVIPDPRLLAEESIRSLAALLDRQHGDAERVTMAGAVSRALAAIDAAARDDAKPGAASGLPTIDGYTGAFRPGELICVAARPGVGKSALALQIAEHTAAAGRPVLFVSLEMTPQEVAHRSLLAAADVPNHRAKAGRLDAAQVARLIGAADRLRNLPITFLSDPRLTADDIPAEARRASRESRESRESPLGLVVVDYLQLLRPADRRAPRHEQVAEMSRGLKLMAGRLGCPVLMLSQLNRKCEEEARAPRLGDIRESGSVEQDCDIVMFLHRPGVPGVGDAEPIDLIVAKQRNGTTGTARLEFHGPTFRFREAVPDAGPPVRFAKFAKFARGDMPQE
jgi:replicative DNA helicase